MTILMTDVAAWEHLWELHPAEIPRIAKRLDELIADVVDHCEGIVLQNAGERAGTLSVFESAADAVSAAVELQRALQRETWPSGIEVRLRAAIDTGEVHLDAGEYIGPTANRCARIRAIAHGGQVLMAQHSAAAASDGLPREVTLADVGGHRVRDVSEPMRLYQLCHPELPGGFPPLRSLDIANHNLPRAHGTFIGRDAELADLQTLVSDERLVTLVGAGGAGKTRLATELAWLLLPELPHGGWLVELAPVTDARLVVQQTMEALGLQDEPGRPLLGTLADYLGTKRLLLVLDNCEHVLEEAAALVEALLRRCRRLRLLCTSREALRVGAESVWRVPSLRLPGPVERDVDALLRHDAVRLFIDRAAVARPGFRLHGTQNAQAVAEIVRRLDGIPLAIELAAARVRSLPPQDIALRLRDHLHVVDRGQSHPDARQLSGRQRTLEATVDWSYDLLSDHGRRLLRRLSVFVGGFTIEAAEEVCAGGGLRQELVLDELTDLVDKSLLTVDIGERTSRLHALEAIRQRGAARLDEARERAEVEERLRRYYLEMAQHASRALFGPDQVRLLRTLEDELPNLRQVIGLADRAGDNATRYGLAAGVWRFLWIRGHLREGRGWLQGVLSAQGLPRHNHAVALQAAGALAWDQGEFRAARFLLGAAQRAFTETGDRVGWAAATFKIASAVGLQSNMVEARRQFDRCLEIARELGDDQLRAEVLGNIGRVVMQNGETAEAAELFEQSLAAARAAEDTWAVMAALGSLGEVALTAGDYATAERLVSQSLDLAEQMGDMWRLGECHATLAELARLAGRLDVAVDHCRTAIVVRREIGEPNGLMEALEELALLDAAEGRHVQAAQLLGAAEALRDEIGVPLKLRRIPAHDACLADLHAALGETRLRSAMAAGRHLEIDEVVAVTSRREPWRLAV